MAQIKWVGKVVDAESNEAIEFASISIYKDGKLIHRGVTSMNGVFQFNIPASEQSDTFLIEFSHVAYQKHRELVAASHSFKSTWPLTPSTLVSEEAVVHARMDNKKATNYNDISRQEIVKSNSGQDLPFLLNLIPGAVINSDAGAGIGYTGIRIRGVDATRINVTINGIPVNDAESQGVFWVNMPDFASSTENIQVQRGVGTSTNGAGAFGATINLQTLHLKPDPYAQITTGFGSFNSLRNQVMFGTGTTPSGWSFDGRLSRITSDGFIDRAASNLRSFYFGANWSDKKNLLKVQVFSGIERTFQAWDGIPKPKWRGNQADLLPYINELGMDQTHLQNSANNTYNTFTYPREIDQYQQDHYQLHYTRVINPLWTAQVSLHYTRGKGYFEQFRTNQKLSDYQMPEPVIGNDTITRTDLARQRWLDNHFYGSVFSFQYKDKKERSLIIGGGLNNYIGDHFGDVVWAGIANTISAPAHRYYENNASKQDGNLYIKGQQNIKRWFFFADLQARYISYDFLGFELFNNTELVNLQQQVNFTFFNPKAGLSYELNSKSRLFLSYSQANREPVRNDFTESTPESRPKPERLHDFEAGYRLTKNKWLFTATAYHMYYQNQLLLTGAINDVGAYTRTNVDVSYRSGLELESSLNLHSKWQWLANLALSRNKVQDFTEFVDNWITGEQAAFQYQNTDLAFSPNLVASSMLRFKPIKHLDLDWISKYVSRQYLDNTQNIGRSLDAFWVNDLRINYSITSIKFCKQLDLALFVNNLLGVDYAPNGYTFSAILDRGRQDFNFVYPQARRYYLANVTLLF